MKSRSFCVLLALILLLAAPSGAFAGPLGKVKNKAKSAAGKVEDTAQKGAAKAGGAAKQGAQNAKPKLQRTDQMVKAEGEGLKDVFVKIVK